MYISNSSNEGDIILDPFSGTGSTLIASKNLNRQYIGYEIDEHYFDMAKNKLNEVK
jgi:DNA modification methylase